MCIATVLRISAALFASSLGAAHPVSFGPPTIQSQYAARTAALQKSNLSAFDACYAPQYVLTNLSGKSVKRTAYLSGIYDLVKGAKKTTLNYAIKGTHAHNGVVDVSFEYKGAITKATGVTTVHEVGEDTWKKIGKTWLLVKTVDSLKEVKAPAAKKK